MDFIRNPSYAAVLIISLFVSVITLLVSVITTLHSPRNQLPKHDPRSHRTRENGRGLEERRKQAVPG